jgi:hypothetical protein
MSTRRSRRAERPGRVSLRRVLVVAVVGLFVLARVPAAAASTLHVTGSIPFFDVCVVQNTDTSQPCYIYANLPDAPTDVSVVQTAFDKEADLGTVEVTWTRPSLTNDQTFEYLISWTGVTEEDARVTGSQTAPSSETTATVSGLALGQYAFTVRLVYGDSSKRPAVGDLSDGDSVTVMKEEIPEDGDEGIAEEDVDEGIAAEEEDEGIAAEEEDEGIAAEEETESPNTESPNTESTNTESTDDAD